MSDDPKIWVDHPKWSETWKSLEKLPGGGQGFAHKARRESDGCTAFVKVIKAKANPERRARFFREAIAYDTIRVRGIPRLIESNALQWGNVRVEPYIATEFIQGPNLRQRLSGQEHFELEAAVEMTKELLVILRACHAARVVHRDVKPDNIILANADATRPCLLDFGLSYHQIEGVDFKTEDRQEIGNRFLRLPELSAGSLVKQDPRSDLSFVAGILFYMLTGQNPDVLQDAEGRLPHQRHANQAKLRRVAGGRLTRLLSLFDTAFAPQIADRFTDADIMLDNLEGVMKSHKVGRSEEELLEDIREKMDTQAARRRADTHARIDGALTQIQRVYEETGNSLGFPVIRRQSGRNISETLGRNTLGWVEPGSNEAILSVRCEVRETGDEIVISLSGEPVTRKSTAAPRYDKQFDDVVRHWLLARLHDAVTNPDALPAEADNFREYRPFGSLEDAQAEARRSGRNILAFVYDPKQEERGRLQHGLGYFLENRKTRETINAAFAVALVPLSQVAAVTTILEQESMERSRWIVFNPDLEPFEQKVIHANPQGGERVALELAKKYSI